MDGGSHAHCTQPNNRFELRIGFACPSYLQQVPPNSVRMHVNTTSRVFDSIA